MPVALWWIRRDVRLDNNPALEAAGKTGFAVLPVFILDGRLCRKPENRRQRFLMQALADLRKQLRGNGSDLLIREGRPEEVLPALVQETAAERVYAEEDYSPFARRRDAALEKTVPLHLTPGLTILPPDAVLKPDESPYTVFTPYSRKWLSIPVFNSPATGKINFLPADAFPPSDNLPALTPVEGFPATAEESANRLNGFLHQTIDEYSTSRDRMDQEGTSKLSPYLRFGMISPAALAAGLRQMDGFARSEGRRTWLNELIWRDFYHHILHHFPFVAKEAFQPKFRQISWRDSPADLQVWKDGLTGYPVVDAAMRQLKSTGWMHNRARMITASFLTKDLLINWQEGESWFMDQLVDGDPASNNGGWQWAAGTGTDAAPYFRIFNPILQGKKFDPDGRYIRRWVPELNHLPYEWIHEPWLMPPLQQVSLEFVPGRDYPLPIVDHTQVRERTLAAYRASAGQ